MHHTADFLAIDLGAASGRAIAGRWDGQHFSLRELHRFPNGPVRVRGHLHWDILRLWQECLTGLAHYAATGDAPLAGIGVDTWGLDFALLDEAGHLLGNPHHYRDARTAGMPEVVDRRVSPERLYALTGTQRLPLNTLYQLVSMQQRRAPQLAAAATLLLLPDLVHYWLTGRTVAEYTIASTTHFLDAHARQWAKTLLDDLNLPVHILPPLVPPGTVLGDLLPEVSSAVGIGAGVPVIAVASHDTASAVAAIPGLDERSAYISSGTWSLVGVETTAPILSTAARRLNVTNEGGVAGTIRVLKNVTGLWLLQECQRHWRQEGQDWSWAALIALAENALPLRSLVDPDTPDFLHPAAMPAALQAFCRRTGQPVPTEVGALVRCCLESLALKYRWVVEALADLTGRQIDTIRIVGGGSQNALLCQLTADACGRRVVAGPVEATALGNILVQAIAQGYLPDIATGRAAIAASEQQTTFMPHPSSAWDAAFRCFTDLLATP